MKPNITFFFFVHFGIANCQSGATHIHHPLQTIKSVTNVYYCGLKTSGAMHTPAQSTLFKQLPVGAKAVPVCTTTFSVCIAYPSCVQSKYYT